MTWLTATRLMATRRRRLAFLVTLVVLVAGAVPPLAIEAAARCLPYPAGQESLPPPSLRIIDRDGAVLAVLVSARGEFHQPLAALPPLLSQAVIAVEDRRFREHYGIDWQAIATAAWGRVLGVGLPRGASTITMQVERLRAAQADAPRPRTLATKLLEAVRARQIELSSNKEAILREWLDRAPFGANLVGAEAASQQWFGCSAADLTLAQAALLAGLPQRPEGLRPDRHPEAARTRRNTVLALMRSQGLADAAACTLAMAEPVVLAPERSRVRGLRGVVEADIAERRADGAVLTTIDPLLQAAATAALERAVPPGLAGALVVAERDGRIVAASSIGGDPWCDLTSSRRSPGSALKPFIYRVAFADGVCGPGSLIGDRPAAWTGWSPANLDHAWRGVQTAADALAESRNLPALEVLRRIGCDRAGSALASLGIADAPAAARRAGLSLAIGGIEVSPRELAGAYAGLLRAATDGEVAASDVLACLSLRERTAALSDVAAQLGVAWKTGTSSGQRDAWCCAVGSGRVAVLWLGVTAGPGDRQLIGVEAAAPACLDLLAAIDPQPTRWPHALAVGGAPVVAPAPLVITSPVEGSEFVGTPEGGSTRIHLTCGGQRGAVWWFDGELCLGRAEADGSLWWIPAPGSHHVRAVDQQGRSAGVAFRVASSERVEGRFSVGAGAPQGDDHG